MTEFDSFSNQLLEEAKAFLEKARKNENEAQTAYLHSSLLIAISALEAFVNSIIDEMLIEPYDRMYSVHERALLLEKEVRFERGEFVLSNTLKISRLTDRIEFLYFKYTGKNLDGTTQWYAELKQGIKIRNELVHPKGNVTLTIKQVENVITSVIETVNELYKVVYKTKFPRYNIELSSSLQLD